MGHTYYEGSRVEPPLRTPPNPNVQKKKRAVLRGHPGWSGENEAGEGERNVNCDQYTGGRGERGQP